MSTHLDSQNTSSTPTRAIFFISAGLLVVSVVLRLVGFGETVGRSIATAAGASVYGIGKVARLVGRYRTAAACIIATPVVGGLAVTAYAAIG